MHLPYDTWILKRDRNDTRITSMNIYSIYIYISVFTQIHTYTTHYILYTHIYIYTCPICYSERGAARDGASIYTDAHTRTHTHTHTHTHTCQYQYAACADICTTHVRDWRLRREGEGGRGRDGGRGGWETVRPRYMQ